MRICVISDMEYGSGASIAACRTALGLGALPGHEVHYIYRYPFPGARYAGVRPHGMGRRKSSILHKALARRLPLVTADDYLMVRRRLEHIRRSMGQATPFRRAWLRLELKLHFWMCARTLKKLLERIKPDVINLHNVGTILLHEEIYYLSRRYKVFWTMHDGFALNLYNLRYVTLSGAERTYGRLPNQDEQRPWLQILLDDNACRIKFITPSRWLREINLPPTAGKKEIVTIPNGVSSTEYYPEDRASARERLRLENGKFYILFVANHLSNELKNLEVLVRAVESLNDPQVRIIAVGTATPTLKARSDCIEFFDRTTDISIMRLFYAAADVMSINSVIENLPNIGLEALFCGRAIIGANVGGVGDIVKPLRSGWLYDPYDPEQLAGIIQRIVADREEIKRLEDQTIEFAKEHFSLRGQAQAYAQLFREDFKQHQQSVRHVRRPKSGFRSEVEQLFGGKGAIVRLGCLAAGCILAVFAPVAALLMFPVAQAGLIIAMVAFISAVAGLSGVFGLIRREARRRKRQDEKLRGALEAAWKQRETLERLLMQADARQDALERNLMEARNALGQVDERITAWQDALDARLTEERRRWSGAIAKERSRRNLAFARRNSLGHTPQHVAFLITVPRAGSTLLMDAIRCHPRAFLESTARLYHQLDIRGSRYPGDLCDTDEASVEIEVSPGRGVQIPSFEIDMKMVGDLGKVVDRDYAIEKLHPEFIGYRIDRLLDNVKRAGIKAKFLYLVRDPRAALSSYLNYQRRNPRWHSAERHGDRFEYMRKSYAALDEFNRRQPGLVLDYSMLIENFEDVMLRTFRHLWPNCRREPARKLIAQIARATAREVRVSRAPSPFLGSQIGPVRGDEAGVGTEIMRHPDAVAECYEHYTALLRAGAALHASVPSDCSVQCGHQSASGGDFDRKHPS